jgi:CheY-like chemotaxis protein
MYCMTRSQVMDGFEMVRRYRVMESERLADLDPAGRRVPLTIIGVSANSDLMAQVRGCMTDAIVPRIANMSHPSFVSTHILFCVEHPLFGAKSQTNCENSVSQSLYLALLVLTTFAQSAAPQSLAAGAGMSAFVSKPFTLADLSAVVAATIAKVL